MGRPEYRFNLVMSGSTGAQVVTLADYKYVSIINRSDNTLELYQGAVTPATKSSGMRIVTVPLYTMITIPLPRSVQYTLMWTTGGAPDPKYAEVIFSDENLNLSGMIGSPSSGGNVIVTAESIGLIAKLQDILTAINTGNGLLGNLATIESRLAAIESKQSDIESELVNQTNILTQIEINTQ